MSESKAEYDAMQDTLRGVHRAFWGEYTSEEQSPERLTYGQLVQERQRLRSILLTDEATVEHARRMQAVRACISEILAQREGSAPAERTNID